MDIELVRRGITDARHHQFGREVGADDVTASIVIAASPERTDPVYTEIHIVAGLDAVIDAYDAAFSKAQGQPGTVSSSEESTSRFELLTEWNGVVAAVKEATFIADLVDKTGEQPAVEIEIPIEDVPRDDLELVTPAGVFVWSIGYRDTDSGSRVRESRIRFRRLPGNRCGRGRRVGVGDSAFVWLELAHTRRAQFRRSPTRLRSRSSAPDTARPCSFTWDSVTGSLSTRVLVATPRPRRLSYICKRLVLTPLLKSD
jgi:hypothetical protein